jgi:hypothetical protein
MFHFVAQSKRVAKTLPNQLPAKSPAFPAMELFVILSTGNRILIFLPYVELSVFFKGVLTFNLCLD